MKQYSTNQLSLNGYYPPLHVLTQLLDLIRETTDYYANTLHMNLVHHGQSDSYAIFRESMCIIMALIGLVSRPCTSSVFDRCKIGGRRSVESYHVICGTVDVTNSRHNGLCTILSTATENLEAGSREEVGPTSKHNC